MTKLEEIRDFFAENDSFAKHNGIDILDISSGRAVVQMDVQDYHYNGAKVVHGGALFTLADYAFAIACNTKGQLSLAVSVSMNFAKAVRGGCLRAVCEEVTDGKLATYEATVTSDKGEIVATFHGLAYRKNEGFPLVSR